MEASLQWYNRVIDEFPDTPEAKQAYLKKFSTILGWTARGQYGSSYGVEDDYSKYIVQLEDTLANFEEEFSDDRNLQRMRFSVAQAHWGEKKFDETREWLNLIITKAKGQGGFYSDLAEWRLTKIEY